MTGSRRMLTGLALASVGAFVLGFGAGSAEAQVAKCQNTLEKLSSKYQAATGKALVGCAKQVAKALSKAGVVASKQADACSKGVSKLAAARAKSIAKCNSSKNPAKSPCTSQVLHQMGHLVSGDNAPGTLKTEFACEYIHETAEHSATGNLFSANPQMQSQLALAADVGGPGSPIFDYFDKKPLCATHACKLAPSSDAALRTGFAPTGIPVPPTGILMVDLCDIDTTGPVGDVILVGGVHSKGINPVVVLGNNVCISTISAEGYCNCSGATVPDAHDVTLCRDSDTSGGLDPGTCAGITMAIDTDPTSNNGTLTANYAGAVPNGGCLGRLGVSFTLFPTGGPGCEAPPPGAKLPGTGIPFTTGTATAEVLNTNDSADADLLGTRTGAPAASCDALRSSNLSGMALAGAVTAMDGAFGDSVIDLVLSCE